MLKDYKNIIIFVVAAFVVISGVSFYLLEIKKTADNKQAVSTGPNNIIPANTVYNLMGKVAEKGENWLKIEETFLMPPTEKIATSTSSLVKVIFNTESKITRGDKAENFQNIKIGDLMFMKTTEAREGKNDVVAIYINIVP